jgi:ribosome-binding ATPase
MALGVGIVGLPNVGKSTLFNAITKAGALAANYPFATIEKNVGVVPLPDERLDQLARVFTKGDRVPPMIPTAVEFIDIAGLVKGAHKGEGLGNQFLSNIRESAAIAHVVRCFNDDEIIHVENRVDPADDAEIINLELILADLQGMDKRVERLKKSAKTVKDDAEAVPIAEAVFAALSDGRPARTVTSVDPAFQRKLFREWGLLTGKPMIYVANVAESDLPNGDNNPHVAALRKIAQRDGIEVVVISCRIEAELSELDAEEAQEYLSGYGLTEPGLNRLVRVAYKMLGLQTFLTAGDKEVRAWTIRAGDKAPQAAGVIHTDLERTFIRAQIVDFEKFIEASGWSGARERGWFRIEGKDYIMQEGDVVEFLTNG